MLSGTKLQLTVPCHRCRDLENTLSMKIQISFSATNLLMEHFLKDFHYMWWCKGRRQLMCGVGFTLESIYNFIMIFRGSYYQSNYHFEEKRKGNKIVIIKLPQKKY